jgi:hypothetical protein
MDFEKYLTEAKKSFGAVRSVDWYKKPEMMGHNWAKEKVDTIEAAIGKHNVTNFQKYIIANTIDFEQTDWHYFDKWSNKDIRLLAYVLKHSRSKTAYELYRWHEQNSAMWKSDLHHALEYAAYITEPEKFISDNASMYKAYGMPEEDGRKRAEAVVKLLEPKIVKKEWAKN